MKKTNWKELVEKAHEKSKEVREEGNDKPLQIAIDFYNEVSKEEMDEFVKEVEKMQEMKKIELKIIHKEEEITIGSVEWEVSPGSPYQLKMPFSQLNEKEDKQILVSGFQNYDFSSFILLIEVIDIDDAIFYYFDTLDLHKSNDDVYIIPLTPNNGDNGYSWFNKVAKMKLES